MYRLFFNSIKLASSLDTFVRKCTKRYFVFVMLSCLFLAALWSPAGKGLTSLLSCVLCFLVFCLFPIKCPGQVWYLIVSIPGPKVIKLEFVLKLKIKRKDCWLRTRVRNLPIIALYFDDGRMYTN